MSSTAIIRYPYDMHPSPPEIDVEVIARAVLQLARRLRAERPAASVTLSALGLLSSLHRHGAMSAAALARLEGLAPQSLSRLLATLTDDGLIVRHPDEIDHRAWIIDITPAGRRALERDTQARRAWLEAAMAAALTPAERGRLAQAAALMLSVAGE